MPPRRSVILYINSTRHEVTGPPALSPLIHYLRALTLTSVKNACSTGGCGSCTVLLSTHTPRRIRHTAVNACITAVAACDGCAITTLEGITKPTKALLTPIQRVLVEKHAAQCGFCVPGFVMSLFAAVRDRAGGGRLAEEDVVRCLDGNLCRCTGYRPILDAYKTLLTDDACAQGERCCRKSGGGGCDRGGRDGEGEGEGEEEGDMKKELVFPPELVDYQHVELDIEGRWLRPVSMDQLMRLRVMHPRASIVAGGTGIGVEKMQDRHAFFLCVMHVEEMLHLAETDDGVRIGASVTWSRLEEFIEQVKRRAEEKGSPYLVASLVAVQSQLQWFAGTQVRNVGSVGGSIFFGTAASNSDINAIWLAAGTRFALLDCLSGKERDLPAREFFSSDGIDMKESEVLISLFVPWNDSERDMIFPFKVSRRKEHDIAIVSAAIRIRLMPLSSGDTEMGCCSHTIDSISIALGGVAPTAIAAEAVEAVIVGKPFNKGTLHVGLEAMALSSRLRQDVVGGMPEFRQALAVGFLFKAFIQAAVKIDTMTSFTNSQKEGHTLSFLGLNPETDLPQKRKGTGSRGVQINPDRDPESTCDQTGKSVRHESAILHVTGEATYLDDVPSFRNELQAALVLSSESHANILSIEYKQAEQMPGVHRIVRYDDIPGEKTVGMGCDEYCFAKDSVTTLGQVVAVVVADTLQQARDAAKLVKVVYERLPAIVTIEEAIEQDSYAPGVPDRTIEKGNVAEAFEEASSKNRVVEGSVRIGAQEHWYMEPHGTIAIPDENGEMTILASTQSPSKTQESVSRVLGVPMHKVVCKVKRLGGGFGGKETRSLFISAAAAVAAQVTELPVRLTLRREEDMLMTGTGHAFLVRYKAGYEPDGRIIALELNAYVNMGNTFDLSVAVLDQALYHSHNCYDIPNVKFVGKVCFTHSPSSTAFRGFGAPQGMMAMETVIEHVACVTKLPTTTVRDHNLFGKNGEPAVTPFGMPVEGKTITSCWDGALKDASYVERRAEVDEFNGRHEFQKRGISAVPTMLGISFSFKPLNQAGALVHIFHQDGSVLISHGGVEMGQGLHTKMCQVAATCLEVPLEKVFISETSTDKVPNASPTAASCSSDLYGKAVRKACQILVENLKPYRERDGAPVPWEEAVSAAWFNRVSLSATGFYKTPKLDILDLGTPGAKGRPYYYFTNGAAVTEVEIDTLTGETVLTRTDIVMDVGRSLNPGIDIGQIEGAFVQGLGWCTMEEVVRGSSNSHQWIEPGQTHTLGLSTYKIPGISDIPKDFRVRVLETRNEQDTIHSSKAIGEPPFFLSASAFYAIRDAIGASRRENGITDWFELDSPASVERIRMACVNKSLSHVLPEGTVRPSLSL